MKRLRFIIPLLVLALIFGFACTGTGLEVANTEPNPNVANTKPNPEVPIEQLIEDLGDEDSIPGKMQQYLLEI